jgi:hypothetical protein
MSVTSTPGPQIAIFGDLEADLWGIVVGGPQPKAAIAGLTDADLSLQPGELGTEGETTWTLIGSGYTLRIERVDEATATPEAQRTLESCRVSGAVRIGDAEREFDVRGVYSTQLVADDVESLRFVGTWFPAGHEIALLSSRPRGAAGHDHDTVDVVASGEEHPLVIDPRLSTTYDEHGDLRRFGVELWLGDDRDGEQWPRRVAGTATGSRLSGATEGASIAAHAMRCVSREVSGAGVYVLARRA